MNDISSILNNNIPCSKKKIKEIATVTIGEFVHKNKQTDDGKYPVFNGGTSNTGYYDDFNNEGNKVIISARGANAGFVNRISGKYWAGNSCYTISVNDTSKVDWNYLYFYLKNNQSKLLGSQQLGSIPAISKKQIEEFEICIPDYEYQLTIAEILDKFLDYSENINNQIINSKIEYEYYRNYIFDSIKTTSKMSDLVSFSQGMQVDVEDQFYECGEGMVPFLRIVDFVKKDEPPRYVKKPDKRYIKEDKTDLIMIRYGANAAGKVFLNKYGAIANNMFKINLLTDEINVRFLWHYLSQEKIYNYLNSASGGSTMPAINFKLIGGLDVPVINLKEQSKIVEFLDKYEKLIYDSEVGLIEQYDLSVLQYEYYRNKLLSRLELM